MYIFTIYVCNKPLSSKPVTREALNELIDAHLNNGCGYFEVMEVKQYEK